MAARWLRTHSNTGPGTSEKQKDVYASTGVRSGLGLTRWGAQRLGHLDRESFRDRAERLVADHELVVRHEVVSDDVSNGTS
jgi:hypothetical protein